MREKLKAVEAEALQALEQCTDPDELQQVRVRFLGRKGELTLLLRGMKDLPPEERPEAGELANQTRARLEQRLEEKEVQLKEKARQEQLQREAVDITLPGVAPPGGSQHPLTLALDEIKRIFGGMGFAVEEGPEIETDYYNFEALNIPADHPARDMQDSYYITPDILLRTHTSPVQARVMERLRPQIPVRIICPGKVYRRDADSTHSPMFHQVEGLAVDRSVTLGDLKGVLGLFAREMFGARRRVRFRPSYFPFTEPSAEMDISCGVCQGGGCRVCSHTGWLEILGAGMVHPRVLSMSGYDPEEVSGFAFGMGVERVAMLRFDVDDIRLFFDNDVRFLRQFGVG